MQTAKTTIWRHLLDRLPVYRRERQKTVKGVISTLRLELVSDHLRRDLGLPMGHTDVRLPRL